MRECKWDDAGFTPKEKLRKRQSLETEELLIELRSLLDSELSKDSSTNIFNGCRDYVNMVPHKIILATSQY